MFHIQDEGKEASDVEVGAIHDERGYRRVRRALSRQYDVAQLDADIQVVDVDLVGDRRLILQHTMLHAMPLDERATKDTLQHLADLWGYDVMLREVDAGGNSYKDHTASPRTPHGGKS